MKNWNFGNIDQYTNIQTYDVIYSRLLENFGLLYPSYYFGTFIFVILLLIEEVNIINYCSVYIYKPILGPRLLSNCYFSNNNMFVNH